ncbi:MAG: hypothetical protein RL213_1323 [Bacteroidota bacterium]
MHTPVSVPDLYELFSAHPAVCTDTRQLTPGCIFFALKGPSFDGNKFAASALDAGASYAVVDDPAAVVSSRCLWVADVLTALQQLANFHRRSLSIPVLAVTGSNGKTTTKELVRSVLSKKYRTLATKGNLNNHIGVPLTLLAITPDIEFAVVEMGANHQGEIASYCRIAEPDFGLITNVGKAHLEGFGGFEGVKKGKGELYAFLSGHDRTIFLNGDNHHLLKMAEERGATRLFRYGTDTAFECSGSLRAEHPFLQVDWRCGSARGEIRSQLIGTYNFENILSAVAVGNHFGVAPSEIDAAIAAYSPDNSRSQLVRRGENTVVLDAYNANPTSMEAALRNFSAMEGKSKVVCIGDMAELGEESDREHGRIAELIGAGGFETVVLVGKNFGKYAGGMRCFHFEDSQKAADWVRSHPFRNATVLIKGSRSTRMERILEAMEGGPSTSSGQE